MRVLIIEDEQAAANRLERMMQTIAPEAQVLDVLESIEQSVQFFKSEQQPDLVFLDIQLADGICFNIFDQVEVTAPIIFTTAYDEFALEAFKVNSIDYLLKPVKEEELKKSIAKWERLRQTDQVPDYEQLVRAIRGADKQYKKRFLIRIGQSIKTITLDEIAYFYSEAKSTFLVTDANKTYTLDDSLDKLETMIDPEKFFRVNRKFIVNMAAIDEMHAYSKARVKLVLKPSFREVVIVSTERSPYFKKWLADEE